MLTCHPYIFFGDHFSLGCLFSYWWVWRVLCIFQIQVFCQIRDLQIFFRYCIFEFPLGSFYNFSFSAKNFHLSIHFIPFISSVRFWWKKEVISDAPRVSQVEPATTGAMHVSSWDGCPPPHDLMESRSPCCVVDPVSAQLPKLVLFCWVSAARLQLWGWCQAWVVVHAEFILFGGSCGIL